MSTSRLTKPPSRFAVWRSKFMTGKVSIGLPSVAALILSLIGGVAQVINYSVISASTQLHGAIAVGLYFLIAAGIPPLTGAAFRAALHLPAWANGLISAGLGAAVLALSQIQMAGSLHEIIATAITVLSALGFNAAVSAVPVVAKP